MEVSKRPLFRTWFFFLVLQAIELSVESQFTPEDIDSFIEEFQHQIQDEIDATPITKRYAMTMKPMSIDAAEERSSDIQRTFEYIAEKTDMSYMQEAELNQLQQALDGSLSYQDLLQRCQNLHPDPECDADSPYRTYDGTCNNLQNPIWGSLLHARRRLLPQDYESLSGFRQSVLGGPLPEPRILSLNVLPNKHRPSDELSNMFIFYAQLLSHDITDTPQTKVNGVVLPCCPSNGFDYPECRAVHIAEDDPFYSEYNQTCLQFVRTVPYSTCTFNKREQLDSVTAFIDAHYTYGRTEEEGDDLKMHDDSGRVVSQDSEDGVLMPPNISEDDLSCKFKDTRNCFKGGDARTNEHAVLMSLHTLLLREHNRMADELKKMNPHWDGERIYQTARKILGAKLQCIAYKEFLPILLDEDLMDQYDLSLESDEKYDEDLNPTVSAEFSAFGFRLHSMTNSQIGSSGCAMLRLRDVFDNPYTVHHGCTSDYLEMSCRTPSQRYGGWSVADLSNYGLRIPGKPYGTDLNALHIQRGRDLGIPAYPDVVEYLTDIAISSFEDLLQMMPQENVDLLQANYADVRDIDAWIGMQLENVLEGSQLSRTPAAIIAEQFRRLKYGDRFYFQNEDQPGSFTTDQIEAIKDTTLSGIVCENTNANEMPQNALLLPSNENPLLSCEDIPPVDLSYWKEEL